MMALPLHKINPLTLAKSWDCQYIKSMPSNVKEHLKILLVEEKFVIWCARKVVLEYLKGRCTEWFVSGSFVKQKACVVPQCCLAPEKKLELKKA
jgi:hypothetical protein